MSMNASIEQLSRRLSQRGFDIVSVFAASAYNKEIAIPLKLDRINENHSHGNGETICVLVGNTKAIWDPFLRYLKQHPEHIETDSPLDSYIEKSIKSSLPPLFSSSIIYSWSRSPNFISLQHCASLSRLVFYENKYSFLCIHPQYGPWFALRSVIILDQTYNVASPQSNTDVTKGTDPSEPAKPMECPIPQEELAKITVPADGSGWKGLLAMRDSLSHL